MTLDTGYWVNVSKVKRFTSFTKILLLTGQLQLHAGVEFKVAVLDVRLGLPVRDSKPHGGPLKTERTVHGTVLTWIPGCAGLRNKRHCA